ncbi:MAG: type I restriction enzyme HsdR N-terminal domain-containing protein [Mucinivorans sp.]
MNIQGDKVWDRSRSLWVKLTPEEHVRQWFVDQLIDHFNVAPTRLATEYSIVVADRRLRVDIAIFGIRSRQVLALVECKAPSVVLCEATLRQGAAYNSTIKARYIIFTNGATTLIYDSDKHKFERELSAIL